MLVFIQQSLLVLTPLELVMQLWNWKFFPRSYVSNGMMLMDNTLNGNHYIGTAFNGLMAGPVNINGVLSIDGNYVVV